METILYNAKNYSEMSDEETRIYLNNERFYNSENFFSTKVSDIACDSIGAILAYVKDHLRTIGDPLVDGLIKIDDEDYAVFTFGEVHAPDLLSRILKRKLPMEEYLAYLSGEKPVASRGERTYFVEKPDNFDEIVAEYSRSHPSTSK